MRNRENKNYHYVSFPTRRVIENSKKNGKKIKKKLKNSVMYSFQAKIGLIKKRNGENNNHRSVSFLPDA